MESLAFCALIKHMFKIDLQKDEISWDNDFISAPYATPCS